MEKRHKTSLKLSLVSIVFMVVSFISVTLAWFAYTGLSHVATEVGVRAWYIEFEKNDEKVSNDIVISLSDIYPGMDTMNETVKIKNMGDSNAKVDYSITSARILDQGEDYYELSDTITTEYIEDLLSHKYPFHININLSKHYILPQTDESIFQVSVSWPLDSGDNDLDSLWGSKAYNFQQSEAAKKELNPDYKALSSIQIIISLTATQAIDEEDESDYNYDLGDTILYDVINNTKCSEITSTCLKTYVIDINNKIGDNMVTLLPDPKVNYMSDNYNNYSSTLSNITTDWTVNNRTLEVNDLLNIISTDIVNSYIIRSDISNTIIGNLTYGTRMDTELAKIINDNGYYRFLNVKYSTILTNNCYWTNTEYNTDKAFAVAMIDENYSKIYGENKTTSCNIVPVLIVNKTNLEN